MLYIVIAFGTVIQLTRIWENEDKFCQKEIDGNDRHALCLT